MPSFLDALLKDLASIREQNLFRELRHLASPQGAVISVNGRPLQNFSSNDYLGLANHPSLRAAATEAAAKFGVGAGASRLICGSLAAHRQLDEQLAAFKRSPAALAFSSGYTAALGAITALLGKDDVALLDRLAHASMIDAVRLSGAQLRTFHHNDLDDLDSTLTEVRARNPRRILVATESVFSMDGDLAPLTEIVEIKQRHGAWLMVDEAHATGLFGAGGRGLSEQLGLSDRIEVQMGTLGKALGSSGGYIAGQRELIDLLVNKARSFIFSTAPSPIDAAVSAAALELVQSPEGDGLRERFWSNVKMFSERAGVTAPSGIVPIILGEEARALAASAELLKDGYLVPAIRYPTVKRGQARLRVTLSAAHTETQIKGLAETLKNLTTA